MIQKNTVRFISLIVLFFAAGLNAGDLEGFKISGKSYFDYTHDISKDGPRANGQDNGFMFRRAYLTINKTINDDFSVRFRTDADRKADDKLRPFVKHLYLKWKDLLPSSALYVGISGTPTWGVAEKVWGYRGLSKTVMDNFKGVTGTSASASSADVGLALKGSVMDKKVAYHAMLANGAHYSHPENDKYKKAYLSVSTNVDGFVLEGYVDHEAKNSEHSNLTYKGFAGYQNDDLAVGAEYYMMTQGGAMDSLGNDLNLSALSVFGRYNVTNNATVVLRYDMYDPNTDANDTETGLVIAALDYRPAKGISVIPNIFYYTNSGVNDNPDIVGNLTFVWSFK
ncbi:MAG: hypothetical protein D8M58_20685 [Calditrichaeota bacterium]|nr:MAG: hypothetical protein DWQ03_01015 [Calditrichota bacterium]MBL1207828.1 hypothetical protein [Calditrichota bacterium]NOG47662.1 hypothetical protein [Calditrichota bacterium]